MAQFCAGYHPDKNPSITVLELPFLGISTLEQEREVSMALYRLRQSWPIWRAGTQRC